MEPVNVHIRAVLAGQVDAALAILRFGILAFPIVGNSTAGNEHIALDRTVLDFRRNCKQLIFCSGTTMLDFRAVPVFIVQTSDVVALIGVSTFRAVGILAALAANQDTTTVGVTRLDTAYADRIEPHVISGGNGHVIRVGCIAGNGDVLALNQVDFRTVRRHGFLLRAVDIQFPAGIDRVRYRLELTGWTMLFAIFLTSPILAPLLRVLYS